MGKLSRYFHAHRKAAVAAVSLAASAYSVQVANGSSAVNWKAIVVSVVLGLAGGGAVHGTPNAPTP